MITDNFLGRPSHAEVARHPYRLHVYAAKPRDDELLWLRRCLRAEVKDCETLNDITNMLSEGGFTNIKPKYVGGLCILLECPSPEAALKTLVDGSTTLLKWFA